MSSGVSGKMTSNPELNTQIIEKVREKAKTFLDTHMLQKKKGCLPFLRRLENNVFSSKQRNYERGRRRFQETWSNTGEKKEA